ncbi:MAG: ATPase [Deltaproteobacteria bacterium]|nr:ATPase [Deltaproteobacteria bacterium]
MSQAASEQSGVAQEDAALLAGMIETIERLFVGKREAVEHTVTALLAQGHVLFEDVPGVGKTTLARSMSYALGCQFQRVQFTSDLLPADIIGVSIFNRDTSSFDFKRGPVFTNLLLADEINRTTPRTQSALLEAMNEGQVSVDGTTYDLPRPFMVLATQNPLEFAGTYPLPESQMDRFLLRVSIGYPSAEVERAIIESRGFRGVEESITSAVTGEQVAAMQERVAKVRAAAPILDYLQRLVAGTRDNPYLSLGVSTRGAIALHRACQARAYLNGRDHVLPDDVKALWLPVCGHRVMSKRYHESPAERRSEADAVLAELLERTPLAL